MKIKKLLILSLSSIALASCGIESVETPKNEVSGKDFETSLSKVFENNTLLGCVEKQEMFSAIAESKEESVATVVVLHSGEEHCSAEEKRSSSSITEYDSSSHIVHTSEERETEYESPNEKRSESEEFETQVQCDISACYTIDLLLQCYSKYKVDNPSSLIDSEALSILRGYSRAICSHIGSNDTKYYIDGNVYTIVNETHTNEDGVSEDRIYRYQLEINNNEFIYRTDSSVNEVSGTEHYTYESKSSTTIKRKSVSLKSVDLNNYLEGEIDFDL